MADTHPPFDPPPVICSVETQSAGSWTRVAVFGEVDYSTIHLIHHPIAQARGEPQLSHIVLDLAGATFMDSTGVRLLVEAARDARKGHYALSVVRGPAEVQRVLDITGVGHMLRFIDDPADAGAVQPRRSAG